MHCDFACLLYSKLEKKLTDDELFAIIGEAVEYEKEFVCEALSVSLIGMNNEMMSQYVEFCADRLLVALGAPKLYNAKNPFDWMELISLQGKTSVACPLNTERATALAACSHGSLAAHPLTVHALRYRNFFEKRVSEYSKANVMASVQSSDSIMSKGFTLEADF